LRPGLDEAAVRKSAFARGIGTMGLQGFYLAAPPRPGLLLGFSAISTAAMPAALRELEEVLAAQVAR
jgi:hypothetical protein